MSTIDEAVQAHVPADLDAPDRILYGLTARQVAILAATAAVLWLAFQALTPALPAPVVGVACVPVAAIAAAVALGRRDGITMDRWLAAAVRSARAPHRLVPAAEPVPAAPGWAPRAADTAGTLTPLRLPAQAIAESGVIDVDDGRVALTAVTTVNVDLRTTGEQHASSTPPGGGSTPCPRRCRSSSPPDGWTCTPTPTRLRTASTRCRTRRWRTPPLGTPGSCAGSAMTATRSTGTSPSPTTCPAVTRAWRADRRSRPPAP